MQFQIMDVDGEMLQVDDGAVDEQLYSAYAEYGDSNKPPFEILRDPNKFLRHFGGITHPRHRDAKGFPIRVTQWTWYQIKFWMMKRAVCLKTNKAGMTTSEALNDFHSRLLPNNAGFDCLLTAQTQKMANEHILDLKKIVLNSPKYSQFVIKRPDFEILKEEKTKVGVMYVRNPYNPKNPSRVIGIGNSEALAYSWKKVNRLHISDPALLKMKKQDDFFGGLFSRLANTDGEIKIEGIPKYRTGWYWKLCRKLFGIQDEYEENLSPFEKEIVDDDDIPDEIVSVFDKMTITIDDVVKAGLISKEYRESMKKVMSVNKFNNLFMAQFIRPEGAAFGGTFAQGEHEPEAW